jgi:hypothetical protein
MNVTHLFPIKVPSPPRHNPRHPGRDPTSDSTRLPLARGTSGEGKGGADDGVDQVGRTRRVWHGVSKEVVRRPQAIRLADGHP